jgi:hypothetical protein
MSRARVKLSKMEPWCAGFASNVSKFRNETSRSWLTVSLAFPMRRSTLPRMQTLVLALIVVYAVFFVLILAIAARPKR